MEGEIGVTGSIIDELHSSDINPDQMEGESGGNGSIIDEVHSWDIQRDIMEFESGVTRILKGIKEKVKVVLREVSLMNFILGI